MTLRVCAMLVGVVIAIGGWVTTPGASASTPWALGPVPAGHSLHIVLALKVNSAGLQRLAAEVSDPASPRYGDYQSIADLSRRFGASRSARRRVLTFLRRRGARDLRVDATGLFVQATLSAGAAEQAFSAPLRRYVRADGARYLAPAATNTPQIPRSLAGAVTHVIGLDTEPLALKTNVMLRHAGHGVDSGPSATRASQQSSALPRTGTPAGCPAGQAAGETDGDPSTAGFTPLQYLTAYGFDPLYNSGFQGQGQRVALIETDSVNRPDVSAFAQCFGFPAPHVVEHRDGLARLPAAGPESDVDVELLDASAPKLKSIDVYEASAQPNAFVKAITAPFQNPARKPSVVSISLGICEPVLNDQVDAGVLALTQDALSEAETTGTTVLAASGDTGSTDCTGASGTPLFDRSLGLNGMTVSYPAASFGVLAVGGTNLRLTPDDDIADQVVWNDAPGTLAASGGGFSSDAVRPRWQFPPFVPTHVGTSGGHKLRAVPDVAMLADLHPGYAVYCTAAVCRDAVGSPWIAAGGTSAATPLLAGGIALVDQYLNHHHAVGIGAPAPLLYRVAYTPKFRKYLFRDVTTGSNDLGPYLPGSGGQSIGCCTAKTGFDEASGFGSLNISHLAVLYLAVNLPNPHVRLSVSIPAGQHPVRSGKLFVVVHCSTNCSAYPFAFFTYGRGRARITSTHTGCAAAPCSGATGELQVLKAAGSRSFVLRFSRAQLTAFRSALKRHLRIRAYVFGAVNDPRAFVQGLEYFYRRSPPKMITITS